MKYVVIFDNDKHIRRLLSLDPFRVLTREEFALLLLKELKRIRKRDPLNRFKQKIVTPISAKYAIMPFIRSLRI